MSDKIVEKLDEINKTLEKMLSVMNKPVNPFVKILILAGIGVSALGIIQIVDTILGWFGG